MSFSKVFNQEVEVTQVYFKNKKQNKKYEGFPKKMIYEGREYTFDSDSLEYQIYKDQTLIKLFDVSDGDSLYRLKLDETNKWTLIGSKLASI